jgi:hypothetical protein
VGRFDGFIVAAEETSLVAPAQSVCGREDVGRFLK